MCADRLKQEISGRFRVARESLKMTPPALAAAVGAAAQTIRDYEDGKSIPGGAVFAGLCELGINANWVLAGKGNIWLDNSPGSAQQQAAYIVPQIDSVLLQKVIEYYASWLRENSEQVRIDTEKHGTVLALLYKAALARGCIDQSEAEQIIRLAA